MGSRIPGLSLAVAVVLCLGADAGSDNSDTSSVSERAEKGDARVDGAVLVAQGAVDGADISGSAGTGAVQDDSGTVSMQAPDWPFQGIVNYGPPLQYWNAVTDQVSEVYLGRGKISGCVDPPFANERYVELSFSGNATTVLRIPWGDEAYPSFVLSEDNHSVSSRSVVLSNGRRIEVSLNSSHLQVKASQLQWNYEVLPYGLIRYDENSLEEVLPTSVESQGSDIGSADVLMDGTDGYHYGFRVIYPEPACPAEIGFIVEIDTGEIVACGWNSGGGLGGALLMSPIQDDSLPMLDNLTLPNPSISEPCGFGMDISGLGIPVSIGQASG